MSQPAISQLQDIIASADDLRTNLPANDRLHLIGLADALRHKLERPEETVYRITFNEVGSCPILLVCPARATT